MNNKTVGIIGAMDCEVNKLKSKLQNLQTVTKGELVIIGDKYGVRVTEIYANPVEAEDSTDEQEFDDDFSE